MRFRCLHIAPRYLMLLGLLLLVTLLCTARSVSDAQRLRQALDLVQQSNLTQAMKIIGPLNTSATMTPAFGRLAFLRATVAQRLQDSDDARRAWTLVWLTYPPLADYASWEIVQDAAQRDDLRALQATVAALGAQYPHSLWLPESQLLLAQTQRRLGQATQAQDTVETFLRAHPSHASVPQAFWLQAQLAEDGGDTAHAARLLRRLGESHPHHALAATAFSRSRQLFATLPASQRPNRDPEEEMATLNQLIQARNWPEVDARVRRLKPINLPAALAARLLLSRAVAAQQRRQRREAIALFERFLLLYPKHPERAEAHYRLAQLYRRQKKQTASETHYRHAAAQHGDPIWAPKALLDLARLLVKRNDLTAASQLYQQLGERFPKHDEAIARLSKAAWMQYRLGHHKQAETLWRLVVKQFPDNPWQPQTFYWLARMAQQQRQRVKAQALYERIVIDYPLHYYSVHERARAGTTPAVVRGASACDGAGTALSALETCHPGIFANLFSSPAHTGTIPSHAGARIAAATDVRQGPRGNCGAGGDVAGDPREPVFSGRAPGR